MLDGAIDVDSLKEMLPIFGTAVVQRINIQQLFTALGVPAAVAQSIAERTATYLGDGRFDTYADDVIDMLETTDLSRVLDTIDIAALRNDLPALALGLLRFVNVGLILAAFGIDPDYANATISSLQAFLREGTDSAD